MQRLILVVLALVGSGGLCHAEDDLKAREREAQAAREGATQARADLARATAAKEAKEAAAKAADDAQAAVKETQDASEALAKASPEQAAALRAALEKAVEKAQLALLRARAAQAAADSFDSAEATAARERAEGNRDFLGVKFNFGFGAAFFRGRIDEAQVVGEGNAARVVVTKDTSKRPVVVLEAHRLLDLKAHWRKENRGLFDLERVTFGLGPFLAIQASQNEIIDAFGLGLMGGFRVGESSAFNLGLGGMLDPSAKFLPPGYVDGAKPPEGAPTGEKLPNGATAVPLVTRGQVGWLVLVSFTF